jgi:hypothetical protein
MKRVMAGEYSRELSTKVSVGQSRGARLGFFQGGHAGYGMRRQLIDENGTPKAILKLGQRKSLQTERIILVLGPPSELKIVRRIFESFVVRKKSRTQIANDLNAAGIKNALGNRWSMQAIDDILRNEKYIGNIVYGRGSVKLGQKRVNNPPETWVRREKALKGIVSPELFAKAQQRIAACLHRPTDQELLDKLSRVWRTKGTLSHKIIMNSKGVPHTSIYFSRFGSLTAAYERIGFQCKPQYQQTKLRNKIEAIIDSLADDIVSNVTKFGGRITYLRELHLLTINDTMTVTIGVATKVLDGTTRSPRWQIRRFKYKRADYFLIMKMDASKTEPDAYFLLPTSRLNRKANQKLRPSSPIFGELYRHDNLGALYRVWAMNHHTDKTPPEVFQATS